MKILDLGLGTDQPRGGELTGTGAAMGTADYMAPEQVSDAHAVDIGAATSYERKSTSITA